jgi:glycosyltransferase involved in cell wall biosynthesis
MKNMRDDTTMISIVTVAHNAGYSLADCLSSVARQTHPQVEHILIDGGSTDETLAIARKYGHITRLVSEPDKGIYDAMNKGIRLAQGDIIGILNADDYYPSSDVLAKVAAVFVDLAVDACYADLQYVDSNNTDKIIRYWRSGHYSLRKFYWGWMPPHPTFFARRSLYERFGLFNLELGVASDYELMLRFLLKHKINAVYIPEVLVKMRTGGVSGGSLRNRLQANRMNRKAWGINNLKPYPWTVWFKPLRKLGQWVFK